MNIDFKNQDMKILAVNTDQTVPSNLIARLKRENFSILTVNTEREALDVLQEDKIDLVLTDRQILDKPDTELTRQITTGQPWLEIIIVTNDAEVKEIPTEFKSRVFDIIHLPVDENTVILKVKNALERKLYRQQLMQYRTQIALNYGFDNIIGVSQTIMKLKETVVRIAPTEITILISGPSGSGKELFARTIHYHSRRRNNRFVAVDFSTLPTHLVESELFGNPDKTYGTETTGLLEQADGGTLFLDEINQMPLSVQNRFLKFLEKLEITSATTKTPVKLDLRIIAATRRNLVEQINQKKFLEDLYYRLNVIPLNIPSLAERTEDIEMLAEYFLRKTAAETGKGSLTLTRNALEKLHQHHWTGNVRELENTLKRGAAFCVDNTIDMDDIMFITGEKSNVIVEKPVTRTSLTLKGGTLDKSQRSLIIKALNDNEWNYTKTAAELGIGRTTLWRKIKKYNLKKEHLAEV